MFIMCIRPGFPAFSIRWPIKAAPLILAGLLASCANLPDLSGYTAATVQVKQSVAAAGDAVGSEIKAVKTTLDSDTGRAQVELIANNFDRSWQVTVSSLDAMVKYAESLEAITAAGNKGAESAGKVADSIQSLATAVGLTPAGPIIGVAAETVAFIYGEIAKVRAAKSLTAAVAASGPVVERLSELIAQQVSGARNALKLSVTQQKNALTASPEGIVFARDEDIAQRQPTLLSRLAIELLKKEQDRNSDLIVETRKQLDAYADARTRFKPALEMYQSKLAAIEKRERGALELVGVARATLQSWSDAHEDLVAAIRNRRTVTLSSLLTAVREARAIIRKWEDL